MLKILIGCKETGCTFLVGGRNVDGAFKVLLLNDLVAFIIFNLGFLVYSFVLF